jgi:hypothetical protein
VADFGIVVLVVTTFCGQSIPRTGGRLFLVKECIYTTSEPSYFRTAFAEGEEEKFAGGRQEFRS